VTNSFVSSSSDLNIEGRVQSWLSFCVIGIMGNVEAVPEVSKDQ